MELNHQIRFCRPFPFRFGFRALSSRPIDQPSETVGLSIKSDLPNVAERDARRYLILKRIHEP